MMIRGTLIGLLSSLNFRMRTAQIIGPWYPNVVQVRTRQQEC